MLNKNVGAVLAGLIIVILLGIIVSYGNAHFPLFGQ